MTALGLFLALLIGLSLGLLGGGGSILTVPVFVYVLGFDPKAAVAMSLPVVGVTSLVGVAAHWRSGRVRVPMALLFGSAAMAGAFGGAQLARLVSGTTQLVLLGGIILLAAASMLRSPAYARVEARQPRADPLILLVGFGVGVLTGLVGVGGGFVIVPALVLLGRLRMKEAVGTSLLVIVMNTAAGFAAYLGVVEIAWRTLVPFTLFAIAGILVGARLVTRLPATTLRRGFAVLLLGIGLLLLWQNLVVAR